METDLEIVKLAFILIAFSALIATSCRGGNSGESSPAADVESPDLDAAVYTSYLEQSTPRVPLGKRYLIVSDTILMDADNPVYEEARQKLLVHELDEDLLRSFRSNNQAAKSLSLPSVDLNTYLFVSRKEIEEVVGGTVGWEAEKKLEAAYPDTYLPIYFSGIGYSADQSRALFFCSRMGADGRYVIMVKSGNEWKIELERWSYIV